MNTLLLASGFWGITWIGWSFIVAPILSFWYIRSVKRENRLNKEEGEKTVDEAMKKDDRF